MGEIIKGIWEFLNKPNVKTLVMYLLFIGICYTAPNVLIIKTKMEYVEQDNKDMRTYIDNSNEKTAKYIIEQLGSKIDNANTKIDSNTEKKLNADIYKLYKEGVDRRLEKVENAIIKQN